MQLLQLQDDAWKLQVFAELEMLKRQLAAMNSLDADLDAMEAKLNETEGDIVGEDFDKEIEGVSLAAAACSYAAGERPPQKKLVVSLWCPQTPCTCRRLPYVACMSPNIQFDLTIAANPFPCSSLYPPSCPGGHHGPALEARWSGPAGRSHR